MVDQFPIVNVPDDLFEAAINKKFGRKPDERLAELDAEASAAIDSGECKNERDAAKKYLLRYGNEGFTEDHRNNRLRDIASRIKAFRRNNTE